MGNTDIAIIGMAGRFPGARDIDAFWRNLREGVESITRFDDDALQAAGVPPALLQRPEYVKAAPVLHPDDVERFDAGFFGFSPKEAELLDPQQRVFMECVWEALERAGYDPRAEEASIALFAGVSLSTYLLANVAGEAPQLTLSVDNLQTLIGNDKDYLATHIAYKLDLRGPAVTVQTACSTSLVAVHLACQCLLDGEADMALAGGVTVRVPQPSGYLAEEGGIFSPDGHCRTFDAGAKGTLFGSGAGVVLLKPLDKALQDGDRIHAIIKGSAVNNDGARKIGYTAPAVEGQARVISEALAVARVEPESVGYVECHGTATPLGDPIEVTALTEVFRDSAGSRKGPCALGSVKTNVGHLESAAGIAGLVKTVLALEHEEIPPSLHFERANSEIDFEKTPFRVNDRLTPWKRGASPRRAGVSSFGIGGTNAHIVLEEAPPRTLTGSEEARPWLVPVSAKTEDALRARAESWRTWLAESPAAVTVKDVAYTAAVRRAPHEQRLAVVASTKEELVERLGAFAAGESREGMTAARVAPRPPKVVFVFPGQGSQWFGMGRELCAHEPVFRDAMEACSKAMRPFLGGSLMDELLAPEEKFHLTRIDMVQPMLFAMQVSLAALWRSWGVEPDAVVGHSMGEVGAAHVAGALSLEDAARVICERSKLVTRAAGRGGMALTELGHEEAKAAIEAYGGRVSIAASNSPRSTVLSGERAALEEILSKLTEKGVFTRWVRVDFASHCAQMDELRGELLERLRKVKPREGSVAIHSTLLERVIDGQEMDAAYWANNLREPVLFATMVGALAREQDAVFVEVSPHPILTTDIEACGAKVALPSLRRLAPERATMRGSLGALWAAGCRFDWTRQHDKGALVDLPTYPWQRERHWIEPRSGGRRAARPGAHPLLGAPVELAGESSATVFDGILDTAALPYLEDHRVDGMVVLPGTAYLEMALASAGSDVVLEDVVFQGLMALPGGSAGVRELQVRTEQDSAGRQAFQIHSRGSDAERTWTAHASGTFRPSPPASDGARVPLEEIRTRLGAPIPAAEHYEALQASGLEYGPRFQGVLELARRDGEALGRLQLPASLHAEARSYRVHPAFLDAAFQVLAGALPRDVAGSGEAYLPVGVARLVVHGRPAHGGFSHATLRGDADAGFQGDIVVTDDAGHPLIEVHGLRLQRLTASARTTKDPLEDWLYTRSFRLLPPRPPAQPVNARASDWLIFADASIAPALEAHGLTGVHVHREQLDPRRPEAFEALLADRFAGRAAAGVLYLWPLDAPKPDPQAATLASMESLGPVGALHLVQALVQAGFRDPPRLWVVTRGAQTVSSHEPPAALEGATLWGFIPTVSHEHPEIRPSIVDLPPVPTANDVAALVAELLADDVEDQIALREDGRHVARLVRADASDRPDGESGPTLQAGDRPYRLEITSPGVLDSLVLRQTPRHSPGPGEVVVAVEAAGLNFLDVLSALGLRPDAADDGSAIRLGGECAGIVTAVGEGVDLRVGDEVVGIAPFAFASHACSVARFLVKKPSRLDFAQAATIPIAFMTAQYALVHLARIERHERILIHAASGGTGLAAVQIALRAGAEIFATAGSEAKRDYLRSIGIRHVFDSRSTSFAEEILAVTQGAGVDVVLNSLSGDAIPKSLEVLAPYGRFLEIGKRDIYEDRKIGLFPFRKNIAYHGVDLSRMAFDRPERFAALLEEVMGRVSRGELDPLPLRSYPLSEAVAAFHEMAQARHIGKIVLHRPGPDTLVAPSAEAAVVRAGATYLITGGLGGVGMALARGLVERGARHLALLGRNGEAARGRPDVEALRAGGAEVRVLSADVADRAALDAALASLDATMPPLGGIVHGAVVLDDGILLQQRAERFRTVLAPKVDGAWNLHAATRQRPLDFFVMLSSTASILGSAGQSNYSAASAFLDALALHRRALGLVGQSINWGPWAEVGLAAAQANRGERGAAAGLASIAPARGVDAFLRLLRRGTTRIAVMPFRFRRWAQSYPKAAAAPIFAELQHEAGPSTRADGSGAIHAALKRAEPGKRRALLEEHLREHIAKVLRLDVARVGPSTPFKSLGLDSLMALSLRNRLEESFGIQLSATLVWGYPTVAALAPYLAEKMKLELAETPPANGDAATDPKEGAALAEAMNEVTALSEDEALAALLER